MDAKLQGKSAIITGGTSGIGLGIAHALADEGVRLAVARCNPDPQAIEELRGRGVEVVAIPTDVSDESQVVHMVATAIDTFGQLDMYVNNAAWTWHQPITRLDTKAWRSTIDTNLSSCVWACREVSRHMIDRRQGSILIIGSTATFTVQHTELAYRVTKTGLMTAMQTLSVELAPFGIRVNMIIPGHYATRLVGDVPEAKLQKLLQVIPMRRTGETHEIGPTAVLLSDALSPYTTGTFLTIDGGLHLQPLPGRSDEEIKTSTRRNPPSDARVLTMLFAEITDPGCTIAPAII